MRILCGGAQCGEYLGDVGPSVVGMKTGPVWYIRPGWCWVFPPGTRGQPLGRAILERRDDTGRAERELIHARYGLTVPAGARLQLDQRVSVGREVDLPVVVRCPRCHRLRYVTPEAVLRSLVPA